MRLLGHIIGIYLNSLIKMPNFLYGCTNLLPFATILCQRLTLSVSFSSSTWLVISHPCFSLHSWKFAFCFSFVMFKNLKKFYAFFIELYEFFGLYFAFFDFFLQYLAFSHFNSICITKVQIFLMESSFFFLF